MAPPRWIAGIRAWIIITIVALLFVCPVIAISINETPDISEDINDTFHGTGSIRNKPELNGHQDRIK